MMNKLLINILIVNTDANQSIYKYLSNQQTLKYNTTTNRIQY